MATTFKMGNSLFEKEKKIMKLTEENQAMKSELENTLQENKNLKERNSILEKKVSDATNNLKLTEIELGSLNSKFNKLKQEHEALNQRLNNVGASNSSNQDKVMSLNNEVDSLNNTIQILQNLEIRLRKEIETLESKNIGLERKIEEMNQVTEEKNKKIEILEKSLDQKNKHIAILVKEKDRVSGNKENALSTNIDKKKDLGDKGETKNVKLIEERKKKLDNNEFGGSNDKGIIVSLENQLKEKDKELEKIRKENFLLSTRLRNLKPGK